jgi:hypothetical protein
MSLIILTLIYFSQRICFKTYRYFKIESLVDKKVWFRPLVISISLVIMVEAIDLAYVLTKLFV